MPKTKPIVAALLFASTSLAVAADPDEIALLERLKNMYPATQWSSVTRTPMAGRVRSGDGFEPRLRGQRRAAFSVWTPVRHAHADRPDRTQARGRRAHLGRRAGRTAESGFRRAAPGGRDQDRARQRRARPGRVQRSQLPVLQAARRRARQARQRHALYLPPTVDQPRPHGGGGRVGASGARARA